MQSIPTSYSRIGCSHYSFKELDETKKRVVVNLLYAYRKEKHIREENASRGSLRQITLRSLERELAPDKIDYYIHELRLHEWINSTDLFTMTFIHGSNPPDYYIRAIDIENPDKESHLEDYALVKEELEKKVRLAAAQSKIKTINEEIPYLKPESKMFVPFEKDNNQSNFARQFRAQCSILPSSREKPTNINMNQSNVIKSRGIIVPSTIGSIYGPNEISRFSSKPYTTQANKSQVSRFYYRNSRMQNTVTNMSSNSPSNASFPDNKKKTSPISNIKANQLPRPDLTKKVNEAATMQSTSMVDTPKIDIMEFSEKMITILSEYHPLPINMTVIKSNLKHLFNHNQWKEFVSSGLVNIIESEKGDLVKLSGVKITSKNFYPEHQLLKMAANREELAKRLEFILKECATNSLKISILACIIDVPIEELERLPKCFPKTFVIEPQGFIKLYSHAK